MYRSRLAVLFGCIAAAALVTSCTKTSACGPNGSAQASTHLIKNSKPAPDFTLTDASGQRVSLSDYKGKVVLLNFWATWCGPCTLEIPWFEQFEQEYKSKGFEVVGVSMDEDGWKAVKPYIKDHGINYRVLLGNDSVGQLYGGVDSLPTTFIINRDGHFAFPPHVGLAAKNEYQSEIQTLVGTKQGCDQPGGASAVLQLMPSLSAAGIPGAAK